MGYVAPCGAMKPNGRNKRMYIFSSNYCFLNLLLWLLVCVCLLLVCQREPREMKTCFHFRASAGSIEFLTNSISNFWFASFNRIFVFQCSSEIFHTEKLRHITPPAYSAAWYVGRRVAPRQAIRSDGRKSIDEGLFLSS